MSRKFERRDLIQLAKQKMEERDLRSEFSQDELLQVSQINHPAPFLNYVDLRSYLWCSIDNEDSSDLDQLTYCEKENDGKMILWIAIADVDALVKKDSPIDIHAHLNTCSIYTPAATFPMLPEKLSTNLTSLNENEDRLAMVIKIQISQTGEIENSSIFQAIVHNFAKLTYDKVGRWLEGSGELPAHGKTIPSLSEVLKIQNEAAQILRRNRFEKGSLTLETAKAEVKVSSDGEIVFQLSSRNLAHQLIEEFMIAANRVMAHHLREAKIASLRRVVRQPKYWDKIVDLAKSFNENLPEQPDSKALDNFLVSRQKKDPDSFPDLSLLVIKLLGRGEYIVQNSGQPSTGHFALGIPEYTHCTAPNRRFPDLVTQRQYKAFLQDKKSPYSLEDLSILAAHCTKQEEAVMKVERQLNKSAAAVSLSSEIGMVFDGIITGASEKGTWVRLFKSAVEGRIIKSFKNLKVGDRVSVRLLQVDVLKGFIDFEKIE